MRLESRSRRRSRYERGRNRRQAQSCSMGGCVFMIVFMVWTMVWHWIGGRGQCDHPIGIFVSWVLIVPFARIIIYTAYALLCCFHHVIGNEMRFSLLVYMAWNIWGTFQVVSSKTCPRFEWYSGLVVGTLVWFVIFTIIGCWTCIKINVRVFAQWMCSKSWITRVFLVYILLPHFANDREKTVIRDVAQQFMTLLTHEDDSDLVSNDGIDHQTLTILIANLPSRKLTHDDFNAREGSPPTAKSTVVTTTTNTTTDGDAVAGDSLTVDPHASLVTSDESTTDKDRLHSHISTGTGFVRNVANRLRDPLRADYDAIPDWTCIVCLEDFVPSDVVVTLPCFHEFHQGCIKSWLLVKPTCPLCRMNISSAYQMPGERNV